MMYFMAGSLWTIVLMAGAIAGYLYVQSKLKPKDRHTAAPEISQPVALSPQIKLDQSSAIKAITPDEIKKEKDKGFIKKLENLISNE